MTVSSIPSADYMPWNSYSAQIPLVKGGSSAENSDNALLSAEASSAANGPAPAIINSISNNFNPAGQKAVDIASSHLNQLSQNVKMPNYTAAGGKDNDCADFASASLADAGLFKKTAPDYKTGQFGDIQVKQFEKDLQAQGWNAVSKQDAGPGDVAIIGGKHTELVATPGATKLIGSNNISAHQQQITLQDNKEKAPTTYYAPPAPAPANSNGAGVSAPGTGSATTSSGATEGAGGTPSSPPAAPAADPPPAPAADPGNGT